MTKFYFKYSLILMLFAVSCNSGEQKEIEADFKEIDEVMDTIEAKMNFVPLTSESIYKSMLGTFQGTPKLSLPSSTINDSSMLENYIEEAAIAQVYSNWSANFKLKKIEKSASLRLQQSSEMLWKSILLNQDKSLNLHKDSMHLNAFFQYTPNDSYKEYFEAISWLENLYVTIQLNEQVVQKTKYHQLLLKQLRKGNDLLTFLYDYQDYMPISKFSQEILEIIDCKNYEIDVTQLKEVVMDARKRIYNTK